MDKKAILSAAAAGIFLLGLVLVIALTPGVTELVWNITQGAAQYTEPTEQATTLPPTEAPTEPPTQPPTEPPTQPPTEPPETTPAQELGLTAGYGFVYDCGQDRYLYAGGNMDDQIAPASLTKLITAQVALKFLDENEVITVGQEVRKIDPLSSVAWLQPGHKLTTRMLIQGLIMQSGNDAAYTLAVAAGRAAAQAPELDIDRAYGIFVDEMNKMARELGMENSHFMNPDGIDEKGHYTTVRDLVILTKASMNYPIIMEYGAMARSDVEFASGHTCTWLNSNYLLHPEKEFYTPEAMGIKTGSTEQAGKCLISLFQKENGQILMVGVLGSATDESRYTDTLYLYEMFQ